jgi:hypothetical protein
MKKSLPFLSVLMALVLTGCLGSLIPKKVELFQDKVKTFPEQSPALVELERQTVYAAHEKATETVVAALKENSTTNVVAPARDTMKLTGAAVVAVGPPQKVPSLENVTNLANSLEQAVGKHDVVVEKFAKANDENAGKKIEGTGLFQIPYFLWLGGAVVLVFIGYIALKAAKGALAGAALVNPGAAVGLGVVNVAQSVLAAGFSQVVKGGEDFKGWVTKEFTGDQSLQNKILSAFQTTQMKAQDQVVQNTIATMTK